MLSCPYYTANMSDFFSEILFSRSHRGYTIKENDMPSTSDRQHPLRKEGY